MLFVLFVIHFLIPIVVFCRLPYSWYHSGKIDSFHPARDPDHCKPSGLLHRGVQAMAKPFSGFMGSGLQKSVLIILSLFSDDLFSGYGSVRLRGNSIAFELVLVGIWL
ncbi:unnamed protein product [Polarella glacialis]|uniref:Uncharacterized protein n=1 Tax=Polarella glacialis TaxID=89957 RepID=A0A813GTI1_POLGL|nr:unnamed protein product [Polarella glacialis]